MTSAHLCEPRRGRQALGLLQRRRRWGPLRGQPRRPGRAARGGAGSAVGSGGGREYRALEIAVTSF